MGLLDGKYPTLSMTMKKNIVKFGRKRVFTNKIPIEGKEKGIKQMTNKMLCAVWCGCWDGL